MPAPAQEALVVDDDVAELVENERDKGEIRVSEEAQRARARGIPVMPPLAERQHHRLLHLPFRSW